MPSTRESGIASFGLRGRRQTILLASSYPASEVGLAAHVVYLRGGRVELIAPMSALEAAGLSLSHRGIEALAAMRAADAAEAPAARPQAGVSQTGVVTWLAVRELWISFRLLALLAAYVGVGALVALLPAPASTAMTRLSVGLAAAVIVGAAIAAGALASERVLGRAGWLVTRSISRGTVLVGWFVAVAGVSLIGLVAAAALGWLAASPSVAQLQPAPFAAIVGGVAAQALALIAIGLLLGTLLPPVPAAGAALVAGLLGRRGELLRAAGCPVPARRARRAAVARPAGRRGRAGCRHRPGVDGRRAGPRADGTGARGPVTEAGAGASVRMHPVAAWATLAVASLGVLLGGAELMVVAIALPSIVADFGGWADLARVSWIINAYLLAYVVAMPLAGRGADLWGARRLYVVALLLFVAGSAGAGLSRFTGTEDGLTWLIVARVVQGFGGGALVPLSMALASHLFTGRQRAAALGLEGAATYVGMAIGPAYGAWVLLSFNLPIRWRGHGQLAVDLPPQRADRHRRAAPHLRRRRRSRDAARPRRPGPRRGCPAVGCPGRRHRRHHGLGRKRLDRSPRPGRDRAGRGRVRGVRPVRARVHDRRSSTCGSSPTGRFSAANAVSLLTGYTLATAIIGGPVFVNRVLFGTDAQASTLLTALTLAIALGALVGGLVSGFIGERIVSVVGVAVTAAGALAGARLGRGDRQSIGSCATWRSSVPASG